MSSFVSFVPLFLVQFSDIKSPNKTPLKTGFWNATYNSYLVRHLTNNN